MDILRQIRDRRQRRVNEWVARAFGSRFLTRHNRAERVLEEALELAQASDYPADRAAALVEKVYARPKGRVDQEIGGVATCLASYAETAGYSVEACEVAEFERVLKLPIEHFQRKLQEKLDSGICTQEAA